MPDRLQQEIDEILKRVDQISSKRPRHVRLRTWFGRRLRFLGNGLLSFRLPQVTVSQLLIASLIAIIIGYVFFSAEGTVGRILVFGGIGGFVLAFVLSLRRSSSGRYPEKRWRGQPMELQGPAVGKRLKTWWERWRTRR
ncbi:MAG TPA: hypothetical protein VNL15_01205 [Dehalococcoidia bacterium]|nr:hypothetical protein [Dehalococcoidia bacterium]